MADQRLCSIEWCGKPVYAKGFCAVHWKHSRKFGDPLGSKRAPDGEPIRFARDAALATGDECIEWPFSLMRGGYGHLTIGGRRFRPAHAFVCELAHGPAPTPVHQAAHSCNNRKCVNPNHLRWATPIENTADKYRHGTIPHGEGHSSTFLTERDVLAMRHLEASGVQQILIAEAFNVSKQRVNEIILRKAWKHV